MFSEKKIKDIDWFCGSAADYTTALEILNNVERCHDGFEEPGGLPA
jgi:hypothetical protein